MNEWMQNHQHYAPDRTDDSQTERTAAASRNQDTNTDFWVQNVHLL